MGKTITLDVPETLLEQAQQEAKRIDQPVERVLTAWLERGSDSAPYLLYALHSDEGAAAAAALMEMLERQADERHSDT